MTQPVNIGTGTDLNAEELGELYASVGWRAYTGDLDALREAIANSTYVVAARFDRTLIGLARGLSDDVSVFYLQDILVRPDWQRRGIGRQLLNECLQRFDHVRQKVLLTDNETAQHNFYKSMGYADTKDMTKVDLHTFVQIKGLHLETDGSTPGDAG